MDIYTFWEPKENIPYYLQLCMETWKKFLPDVSIHVLDYKTIKEYINVEVYGSNLFSGRFSLAQISDAIRALVLMKHGGVWLDVDTIFLSGTAKTYFFPSEGIQAKFFGDCTRRTVHIAATQAQKESNFLQGWVEYCKEKIVNFRKPQTNFWAYLGNSFVNPYVKSHPDEIMIYDAQPHKPEFKFSPGGTGAEEAYRNFYFCKGKTLGDLEADMLILHNSWTPDCFKKMGKDALLGCDCTMANVLIEVLELKRDRNRTVSYVLYEKKEAEKEKRQKEESRLSGMKRNLDKDVDYNFLYPLWRILHGFRPRSILDFNLDKSTEMVAQYAAENLAMHTVLEHDRNRAKKVVEGWNIPWDHTSIMGSALLHVKLKVHPHETAGVVYQSFDSVTAGKTYDLILLKSPFVDEIFIHMDLLKKLPELLRKDFALLMDHVESSGGRRVLQYMLALLQGRRNDIVVKPFVSPHRAVCVITTKRWENPPTK